MIKIYSKIVENPSGFEINFTINTAKGKKSAMSQLVINTGAAANDGTGDPLRTAFTKTNLDFDQVFEAGPVGSNVRILNNRIITTNTNGNLVLSPNGTGSVVSNVSVIPNTANVRNLGSSSLPWSTVYTQYVNVSGSVTAGSFVGDGSAITNQYLSLIQEVTATAQTADSAGLANIQIEVSNSAPVTGLGVIITSGNVNTNNFVSGNVELASQYLVIDIGAAGANYTAVGFVTTQAGTVFSNEVLGTSGL